MMIRDMVPVGIMIIVSAYCHHLVASTVPTPYMDEIFHVPQAQHYCKGDWTYWDKNITTLPGSYLGPALLAAATGTTAICSLSALRAWSLSWLIAAAIVTLYGNPAKANRMKQPSLLASLMPVLLVSFPPLSFSSLLFYTDSGSLFWTLLSTLALQHTTDFPSQSQIVVSALAGGMSILYRQTSAVWLVYAAAQAAWPFLLHVLLDRSGGMIPRILASVRLTMRLMPITAVLVAFVAFTVFNGGVVVGDRTAHQPRFHFAQLCYAIAIMSVYPGLELCAYYLLPPPAVGRGTMHDVYYTWVGLLEDAVSEKITESKDKREVKRGESIRRTIRVHRVAVLLLLTILTAFLLHHFSYTHPYIRADNRHLSFYIFSRIFNPHPILKAALAPVYVACGVLVVTRIAANEALDGTGRGWMRGFGQAAIWILCTAVAVVPAYLLEFRYFVCPTIMGLLLMWQPSIRREEASGEFSGPAAVAASAATATHALLHVGLLYMFLYRPYMWPDGSVARLMW